MVKFLFVAVTLSAALILEWGLGVFSALWGVAMPLLFFTLIIWFWRLNLSARFWLGISVGFFMDSLLTEPFGTYIVTFILLALLTEFLQFLFSNLEYPFTKSIGIGISLFIFLNFVPLWGYILGLVTKSPVAWGGRYLRNVAFASLGWAVFLALLFWASQRFYRFLKLKF